MARAAPEDQLPPPPHALLRNPFRTAECHDFVVPWVAGDVARILLCHRKQTHSQMNLGTTRVWQRHEYELTVSSFADQPIQQNYMFERSDGCGFEPRGNEGTISPSVPRGLGRAAPESCRRRRTPPGLKGLGEKGHRIGKKNIILLEVRVLLQMVARFFSWNQQIQTFSGLPNTFAVKGVREGTVVSAIKQQFAKRPNGHRTYNLSGHANSRDTPYAHVNDFARHKNNSKDKNAKQRSTVKRKGYNPRPHIELCRHFSYACP